MQCARPIDPGLPGRRAQESNRSDRSKIFFVRERVKIFAAPRNSYPRRAAFRHFVLGLQTRSEVLTQNSTTAFQLQAFSRKFAVGHPRGWLCASAHFYSFRKAARGNTALSMAFRQCCAAKVFLSW
ncbi:hypothetical protein Bxe_B1639 [Paraburkholderia xenovorans LB400]|uniref:Uncharacterized protein n=1 Tax=Paraburkholderia xenovorans (strain LB400) TaxID=266265 RepID=Q13NL3_PARXL|nr:hypothetical protein Bxe_B1639 [Paraburkholderia xenovorans LB400]